LPSELDSKASVASKMTIEHFETAEKSLLKQEFGVLAMPSFL